MSHPIDSLGQIFAPLQIAAQHAANLLPTAFHAESSFTLFCFLLRPLAAAVVLILISVLSAIGICERCRVQSGGVYFLIAHVLGSRRGAAVGIIYVLGQVCE